MNKAGETAGVITYRFSFDELAITRSRLESLMGYDPGAMPAPFTQIIDEILSLTGKYCNIRGGFIIKDHIHFSNEAHLLSVDNVTFNLQNIVYGQLQKAGKIAVFVCTAGPGIPSLPSCLSERHDI